MNNRKELSMDMSVCSFGEMKKTSSIKMRFLKPFLMFFALCFYTSAGLAQSFGLNFNLGSYTPLTPEQLQEAEDIRANTSTPETPTSFAVVNRNGLNDGRWAITWQRSNTGPYASSYQIQESVNGGSYVTIIEGDYERGVLDPDNPPQHQLSLFSTTETSYSEETGRSVITYTSGNLDPNYVPGGYHSSYSEESQSYVRTYFSGHYLTNPPVSRNIVKKPFVSSHGVLSEAPYFGFTTGDTSSGYRNGDTLTYRVRSCFNNHYCSPWAPAQEVTMVYRDDSVLNVQSDIYSESQFNISWTLPASEIAHDVHANTVDDYGLTCSEDLLLFYDINYRYRLQERELPDPTWRIVTDRLTGNIASDYFERNSYTTGSVRVRRHYTVDPNPNFRDIQFNQLISKDRPGRYEYRLIASKQFRANCIHAENYLENLSPLFSYATSRTQNSRIVTLHTPEAPTQLNLPPKVSSEYTVSWNESSSPGEKYYELEEEKVGGEDAHGFTNVYTGSELSKTLLRTDGERYSYRVRACYDHGCGEWSSIVDTDFVQRPTDPVNIQLISNDDLRNYAYKINGEQFSSGRFRLFFGAPSNTHESDISSYRIRVSKNGGAYKNLEEVSNRLLPFEFGLGYYRQYDFSTGVYRFEVQACNSVCGCGEFAPAENYVEVLGVPNQVAKPYVPLESDGTIELDWNTPSVGSAATFYEIYQSPTLLMSTEAGKESAYFTRNPNSGTSISMHRRPGKYKYQVRGCNLAGCGAWSQFSREVEVLPPGTPENFTVVSSHEYGDSSADNSNVINNFADDDGNYSIKWKNYESDVLDVTYFLTEIDEQGESVVHPLEASPFIVSDKLQGNYSYQLKACIPNPGAEPVSTENANPSTMRCGDPTRLVNVEVLFRPSVPDVSDPVFLGSSIELNWGDSENATYYQVEQTVNEQTRLLADQSSATSRTISLELLGSYQYSYKVRACSGNTAFELCSAYSAPVDIEAAPEFAIDQAPLPQVGVAPAQPDNSDRVGSLSGNFRVDESGAATYQVEIDTAPGTAGVTPKMGLYYSSQGGNGLMGTGWNITGQSNIARCRSTLGQDQQALPIQWNEDDRFCLDGQRLLVVNDGVYGANGTRYKTEIDTFVTVESVGGSVGNPDYFEVTRKDGSKSYYGMSVNSDGGISNARLTLGSKVLSWGMNEFADSVGNQVTFQYSNEDGYQYLEEIGYAYGNGTTPRATITYSYENRPDPMTVYISGESQSIKKRLSKIESNNEQNLLRQYNFVYQRTNQLNAPSRLVSIEMCTQGNVCLPETRFDWITALESEFPSRQSRRTETIGYGSEGEDDLQEASNSYLSDAKFGDINGDGLTDIIYTTTYIRIRKRFFSKPSVESHQRLHFLINSRNGFAFGGNFYYPDEHEEPINVQTVDYNADGRTDVLVNSESRGWHLYLATATGVGHWTLQSEPDESFPFSGDDIGFADMNSDGLVDVFDGTRYWLLEDKGAAASSRFPYHYTRGQEISAFRNKFDWNSRYVADPPSVWGSNRNSHYYSGDEIGVKNEAGDVNGDGVSDFLLQSYGYQIALSVVEGDELVTFKPADNNPPRISDHTVTQFTDFNGDGLSDVIYWHKGSNALSKGWKVQLSTGTGFRNPISISQIIADDADDAEDNRVQPVDVNNDGYPDIVWQDETRLRVRYWNQTSQGFTSVETIRRIEENDRNQHLFADFNGDTVNDYVRFEGYKDEGGAYWFYHARGDNSNWAANNIGNVIHRITNGLGAQTNMHYERLSLTNAYMQLEPEVNSTGCRRSRFDNECSDGPFLNDYTAFNVPFGDLPDGSVSLQKETPLTRVFVSNSPIPLVTEITSSAPTMENPDGMSKLEYGYGHAKVQMGGRGNLGFKYLSTRDTQTGVVTTNTYRQDWPFVGYPLSSIVETADKKILSESSSEWTIQSVDALDGRSLEIAGVDDTLNSVQEGELNSLISDAKNKGTAGLGPIHVYVKRSTEKAYALEDVAGQRLMMSKKVTTTKQDKYGNTVELRVDNYDGAEDMIQQAITINTYGTSPYEKSMGRLSHTLAKVGRPNLSNREKVRDRESAYEYFTSGNLKGLMSKEIIEPKGDESLKLEITHSYDEFGNRVQSKSKGWDGKSVVTRFGAREEYDAYGRYMVTAYQAYPGKGEVRTSQVLGRNDYGSPTEVVDVNGVRTYTAYSKMGVEYFSTNDMGGWVETYLSTDMVGNYCPSYAAYVQITKGADGAESRECFDMLARSIRTLARNFDGSWVANDVRYDNIGRTIYQSVPYASTGGDQVNSDFTSIEYDITGRTVYTILPDGSDAEIMYNGFHKTEINDLKVGNFGQRRTEVINSLGEVTEVINYDKDAVVNIKYYHNDEGELIKMVDAKDNITTIDFDKLNRKIGMNDPDKGVWSYRYNAFGEMIEQQDAKGQILTTEYDILGRQIRRVDYRAGGKSIDNIENTTRWSYDNNENGIGQISKVVDDKQYIMEYEYDLFGRSYKSTMSLPGLIQPGEQSPVFESWQTYDQFGRTFQAFDASSNQEKNDIRGVQTVYNQFGFVSETRDVRTFNGPNGVFYKFYERTLAVDARGNVVNYVLGNGVEVVKTFNNETGRLETVKSTEPFSSYLIQDLEYEWDTIGNLKFRHDRSGEKDLLETFTYDNLNRLELTETNDIKTGLSNSVSLTYDELGNITSKSDVGNYTYGNSDRTDGNVAGPHAVINAGGKQYSYDENGNNVHDDNGTNTAADDRSLTYNTFDKVTNVVRGAHRTTFSYGPERSRYKRVDYESGSIEKTTYYLGNVEYIAYANGDREYKRQLGMVLETLYYDGDAYEREERHYLLQDHLGSTDLIVGEEAINLQGNIERVDILEELSFDPWGQRRDPETWEAFSQEQLEGYDTSLTTRGFTGHEMVDGVGIIHMNGRIYDATLARFLQADPIIQEPYNTQSLNRYSYVWNNPLNATDPSGYEAITLLSVVIFSAKAAAVTFAVTTVFALAQGASLGQALNAGFEAGLNAFATSLISAGLFGPGFTNFFDTNLFTQAIGSGIQGGVTSVIQGGKFGDGFISSALSTGIGGSKLFSGTAADGVTATGGILGNAGLGPDVRDILLAGTVSELTGGKFVNGAVGAASSIANKEVHGVLFKEGGSSARGVRRGGKLRNAKDIEEAYNKSVEKYGTTLLNVNIGGASLALEVSGPDGFAEKVESYAETLNGSKTGRSILRGAYYEGKPVRIFANPGQSITAVRPLLGKYNGSVFALSPNGDYEPRKLFLDRVTGKHIPGNISAFESFTHELVHVWQNNTRFDIPEIDGRVNDGIKAEQQASNYTNQVRKELGIPQLRLSYN